ncbi:MAG: hypothetical protein RLZZ624_1164 [Cyanobacteriota bacterium]|jgi:hypothetical protein
MTRSRFNRGESPRYDRQRSDGGWDAERDPVRDRRGEGSDREGGRSSRYGDDGYGRDWRGSDGRDRQQRGARDGGRRSGGPGGGAGGGPGQGGDGQGPQINVGQIAVLAGVLVVGIGIGTGISSTTQGNQGNIASSQQLDMAVADPEFCKQWGASAFVMDVQMYTTMNPSTSFVTQPKLQPGCVIRRENWSVLQKEGAVTAEQMRQCKQRMNTFAYIGSVKDKPEVRCVYQTDIVDNKFQTKGVADDTVGVTPEADQF